MLPVSKAGDVTNNVYGMRWSTKASAVRHFLLNTTHVQACCAPCPFHCLGSFQAHRHPSWCRRCTQVYPRGRGKFKAVFPAHHLDSPPISRRRTWATKSFSPLLPRTTQSPSLRLPIHAANSRAVLTRACESTRSLRLTNRSLPRSKPVTAGQPAPTFNFVVNNVCDLHNSKTTLTLVPFADRSHLDLLCPGNRNTREPLQSGNGLCRQLWP